MVRECLLGLNSEMKNEFLNSYYDHLWREKCYICNVLIFLWLFLLASDCSCHIPRASSWCWTLCTSFWWKCPEWCCCHSAVFVSVCFLIIFCILNVRVLRTKSHLLSEVHYEWKHLKNWSIFFLLKKYILIDNVENARKKRKGKKWYVLLTPKDNYCKHSRTFFKILFFLCIVFLHSCDCSVCIILYSVLIL